MNTPIIKNGVKMMNKIERIVGGISLILIVAVSTTSQAVGALNVPLNAFATRYFVPVIFAIALAIAVVVWVWLAGVKRVRVK